MNSQNLILLGIGIFVSLIVGVVAIDQYMMNEHDPMHPDGLIWRVQTAFTRVKDLEAVVAVTEEGVPTPTRMLVRFVSGTEEALSVRYLSPDTVRDELFTVSRDLISHYIPREELIVVKRWAGFPLSALGLATLTLQGLDSDWKAGKIRLKVVRGGVGFDAGLFRSPLELAETISGRVERAPYSVFTGGGAAGLVNKSFALVDERGLSSIQGGFILEASDARTGELVRMVWIDPETFLVRKVVTFADGQRKTSIEVERLNLNQGLTPEEILALPRGVEVIHG